MAVKAQLFHDDGMVVLGLHPGEQREWIGDEPDDRSWPFYFAWDAPKLERGEYELGVLEVPDVSLITDNWLAEIDKLDLPRVDVAEAKLFDATISDVLRWARKTYPSRYTRVST